MEPAPKQPRESAWLSSRWKTGFEPLSKIEFVRSPTRCPDVARRVIVLRPEGPLCATKAIPNGLGGSEKCCLQGRGLNAPFRAQCVVNRVPGLTAWGG